MIAQDWERSERGVAFVFDEARRLLRRARPKMRWVLVLSLLCATAYPIRRIKAKRTYDAQMVLRLVEADKELTKEVRPHAELFAYIWGVFLSGPNLKKVIERHHIYADKWERDPQLAVEAMRNDLDVVVWRNYFVEAYSDDDEARSARVSITWHFRDPEVTLAVVRALGEVIVESQTESRREVFALAQQDVDEAADGELDRLVELRQRLAETNAAAARATPARQAALLVQLSELKFEVHAMEKHVEELASTRTRLELTAAWERQRSGIQFEIVEPGVVVPQPLPGPIATGFTTVAILGLGILLGGLLVGAFESKLRQPEDVRRLGVPVLGAMPVFPGDTVGALTERVKGKDRLRWSGDEPVPHR
jgi:hypothetical protein